MLQVVEPVAAMISECLDDMVLVKDVWDTSMLCELQFEDWRSTLWNDIRTEVRGMRLCGRAEG